MSSAEPVLQLRGLTAGYDGLPAVRDVTLDVGPGEVVALLGPNGAGKTTSLGAVSGLVDVQGGSILFDGEDLAGLKPHVRHRRGIAHVPEGRGIFPTLTVAEHFQLRHAAEANPDVAQAYAHFPKLATLKDRPAGLLSGGEQQMLAVGRALVRQPKLLLLDELSLGLAPIIVEQLLPIVREFATASGCGVLLVEQHVPMALGVADRGYVLTHGSIVHSGPADQLSRDRHLIEASYLGEGAR